MSTTKLHKHGRQLPRPLVLCECDVGVVTAGSVSQPVSAVPRLLWWWWPSVYQWPREGPRPKENTSLAPTQWTANTWRVAQRLQQCWMLQPRHRVCLRFGDLIYAWWDTWATSSRLWLGFPCQCRPMSVTDCRQGQWHHRITDLFVATTQLLQLQAIHPKDPPLWW